MVPQFTPATERWQARLSRGPKQLGTFPVVGWAVFAGFAVEPMVYYPLLGRVVTVKDLAVHNQDPLSSVAPLVHLERVS